MYKVHILNVIVWPECFQMLVQAAWSPRGLCRLTLPQLWGRWDTVSQLRLFSWQS